MTELESPIRNDWNEWIITTMMKKTIKKGKAIKKQEERKSVEKSKFRELLIILIY